VNFLELVLQNFGPYVGRQVINLQTEIDDQTRPIILLGGMNGGGKTTLMDAIRLALYGHRAQCSNRGNLGYGEFLTQSVNRHTSPSETTRVELAFEHIQDDRPVKLRIVRYWMRNPKDGRDTLGVLEDDEWPDTALVNTWDEFIENLLPLGISNLFLFDGEQVKELAEQETPPPIVIEAIRALLGLELAERLAVDLDILVNRKRKVLADTQALANLEAIEQKLKQYQEQYQAAEDELKELKSKLAVAERQEQEASDKFISDGGKIAGERSLLDKQLTDLRVKAETTRQAMCELAADVLPLALISPLLTQAQKQGKKEYHQQQAKIAQDVLKERDDRLLQHMQRLALSLEQVDKIKAFLEQDNQELEQKASKDELWLATAPETLSSLAAILDYYLPTQIKLAGEQLVNLKDQEAEIEVTERQIAVAAPPEVYKQLKDAVREAQAYLAEVKAASEIIKRKSEELAEHVTNTKKDLEDYSEKNIDRKNDEHIITASAKVQSTLKLFRERLTLRKLNQLESVVTECFLYLLHKSDLVHRVAIDTSSFSLSLYDLTGKLVPKHRLSAGEKQLLAIAFLWGLARVSGHKLPVAIDTPLGRLDSSHRQNLVERYFPAASHQVILLSTDTEIGEAEVKQLRDSEAIAREYLLKYDSGDRQTTIVPGYFW
jgi:DNA sulfur modification protein DndD